MEYWSIGHQTEWLKAFHEGYGRHHAVTPEFRQAIAVYKCLWFILVFNFEMDKVRKQEQRAEVDRRFPAAEIYLPEIEKIVRGD
jgi:hypothetical protein